ncbi:MAG TPA: FAD-dependent oxidoreductase [Vicinamibacterales bacterium]|nr:FAD-dependent oxidoreductase [Vicinamibacterales bacterium]
MRVRDLDRLTAGPHDLLVIGGGIYGLAIAANASRRGLRVALVEAADFGSGLSFNHQKTAHGGLRALQSASLRRAREAIRERRALARLAPRLLRPLPFIIGTYHSATRNRLALRAAFAIDAWLARDRNDGVEPELHLPAARLVSRAATLKLFPGVRQDGLTGGAMWYDYQMVAADRLTLAFGEAADAAGAALANYVEALDPLRDGDRIAGMRVRDALTNAEADVRATLTINAAGSRAGDVMRRFGVKRDLRLLKAMNLVTRRPANDIALAAPDAHGRMLTLVPWHGRALVGTSQSPEFRAPDDVGVTASELESFVRDANTAFPTLRLAVDDVWLVHRGIVPAIEGRGGRPELMSSPQILDHAGEGAPGAMTVVGVKYTTARGVAARVVERAARRLGRSIRLSGVAEQPLPGAGIADHEALAIEAARAVSLELAPATILHLIVTYGDRCVPIIELMAERSDWRMPLAAGRPNVGAEVVHTIRHEMAQTLADVVIRRTELGAAGHPGDDVVHAAARVAGEELGWSPQRSSDEIAAVNRFYEIAP